MAKNITPRGFVIGTEMPKKPAEANSVISSLYEVLLSNSTRQDTFSYEKMVLIEFLRAFETKDFRTWYLNQFNSPYFDEQKAAFLNDTLRFIMGHDRKYDIGTWEIMLTRDEPDAMSRTIEILEENRLRKIGSEVDTDVSFEFFGISSGGKIRTRRHSTTADVFKSWAARPRGIQDIVVSLYIIFGPDYLNKKRDDWSD